MSDKPDDAATIRIGNATVADNLRHAIESGAVIEDEDGSLRLTDGSLVRSKVWMSVPNGPTLGCEFLKHFMFRQAYAQSAVPYGCRACFKVKVTLRTLRELAAAWEFAKGVQCRSKWGIDFYNPHSQSVYAGLFYTSGLAAARATYKLVREGLDKDPKLGPDVPITIKRGCSEYEALLGPSDGYEFAPEQAEIEERLKARYQIHDRGRKTNRPLEQWIRFAYQMGDETYLDFTGGKPFFPKAVAYNPD